MSQFFKNVFKKSARQDREAVAVVSGLPRSGTSMVMKMLEAGGLSILTDGVRAADEDNPKGYYELERVKKMVEGDLAWLEEAPGKAVKVISALLKHLPAEYDYKVIFIRRKIAESLASQRKMLVNRDKPTDQVSDEKLAELFRKHLDQVDGWLSAQPNFEVLYVNYNQILEDPGPFAAQINEFLGGALDVEEMTRVVDARLYRQRG